MYESRLKKWEAEKDRLRWEEPLIWLAVFFAFVGGCLTGWALSTWNNPGLPRWLGW